MDDNKLYACVEDLGEWIGNLETAVGQILGYLPKRNKIKTLLAALLITLSFNALAGDNLIQQQLKLQQNLMRIQQQNQQSLTPERHEERREQNQQPYYNQPYQGNGGHEGSNFGSNSRHYSRGLGYYGSFYNAPYVYLPPVPQPQTNYWYYCQDPEGYYPNVDVCQNGWQQVAPQPDDD